MKQIALTFVAAVLALGVGAAANETSVETEVYINIPGERAVHCPVAKVTFIGGSGVVVQIETKWGVTYTTHLANVVLVTRKNPAKK